MYAIKSTQRGDDIQEHIIQACLRILKTGRSWEDLSVVDLCSAIEISRKTFYRNFECKNDAVNLMLDQFIASICAKGSFPEMLKELEKRKDFMDIVARNDWYGLLRDRWIQFGTVSAPSFSTQPMFSTYKAEKANIINSFFISGYITTLIEWHRSGYMVPRKDLAELLDIIGSQDLLMNPYLKNQKFETIQLDKYIKP